MHPVHTLCALAQRECMPVEDVVDRAEVPSLVRVQCAPPGVVDGIDVSDHHTDGVMLPVRARWSQKTSAVAAAAAGLPP